LKKTCIVFLCVILLVLTTSIATFAAEETSFCLNPISLVCGIINGQYEMKRADEKSLFFSGELMSYKTLNWEISGLGAGVGLRTYYSDKKFSGVYSELSGRFAYVSTEYEDKFEKGKGSGTAFGLGCLGGYKWLFEGGFTLELGAGATFLFGNIKADGVDEEVPLLGFAPTIALNLGYSW